MDSPGPAAVPGAVPAGVPGAGCAAVSGARGWLVRAGRPRGELLVHLTGKLTRGPAGQIPGLIRRLAAAAEGYRRAKKRRTRVFAGAFRRCLGQLDLLKRT